jgi:hypothetical protein
MAIAAYVSPESVFATMEDSLMRLLLGLLLLSACVAFSYATDATASTPISGTITTDTWTSENSPYRISGAVTVPSGETLTIEAGVDVLFDSSAGFRIEGALHVFGTEADSVRFQPGDSLRWGGIVVWEADSVSMEYARLSGSGDGCMYVVKTPLMLRHVVMRGNGSDRQYSALYIASAAVTVDSCVFRGNDGESVVGISDCPVVRMSNCQIADNPGQYRYLSGVVDVRGSTVLIDHTLIVGNGGTGVHLERGEVSINNCTIADNSGDGVDVTNEGGMKIRGSILWGNASDLTHSSWGDYEPWPGRPEFPRTDPNYTIVEYSNVGTLQSYPQEIRGRTNVTVDPRFDDEYRLMASSQCIDSGDPYILDEDGTRSDIGAFGGTGSAAIVPRIAVTDSLYVATAQPETLVIRNNGLTDLTIYELTETGGFYWQITLPLTIPAGDSALVPIFFSPCCDNDGTLWIIHSDTFQSPMLIRLTGLRGTLVRGEISGVWSAEDGPYHVVDDAVVPQDDSLLIEPGVQVRIGWVVKLQINGRLNAVGSDSGRIRFEGGHGLDFAGGDSSTVSFVDFWKSGYLGDLGGAVTVLGTGTRVAIRRTLFAWAAASYGAGVYAGLGTKVSLQNCTFGYGLVQGGESIYVDEGAWVGVRETIVTYRFRNRGTFVASYSILPAGSGEYMQDGGTPYPGDGNINAQVGFRHNIQSNWSLFGLAQDSPAIDAGDPDSPLDPDSSRADIGAFASPYGTRVSIQSPFRPIALSLERNVPNPFNPTTQIGFTIPEPTYVSLGVYDATGRLVRRLVDGSIQPGRHMISWDGTDSAGRAVGSGVYLYRLTTGERVLVRRMLLVR